MSSIQYNILKTIIIKNNIKRRILSLIVYLLLNIWSTILIKKNAFMAFLNSGIYSKETRGTGALGKCWALKISKMATYKYLVH